MREPKIGILFRWTKGKKREAFRHFDVEQPMKIDWNIGIFANLYVVRIVAGIVVLFKFLYTN